MSATADTASKAAEPFLGYEFVGIQSGVMRQERRTGHCQTWGLSWHIALSPCHSLLSTVTAVTVASVTGVIESIAGHLAMGPDGLVWFVITYCDGNEEHRQGTLLEASHLASSAGLHLAPSGAGTFRYIGKAKTWRSS